MTTARTIVAPQSTRYALAPQGVYLSIQGEGALLGLPMVFIRLAGCSVGCGSCDTDYRVANRATAGGIAELARRIGPDVHWAWITGGEPADRDLMPLVDILADAGFSVAVATSGHVPLPPRHATRIAWLSVSPHNPAKWVVKAGQELKLVPYLGGFGLADFEPYLALGLTAFGHHYAIPCHGKPETIRECVDFVGRHHPRFRLGVQAHRLWGLD